MSETIIGWVEAHYAPLLSYTGADRQRHVPGTSQDRGGYRVDDNGIQYAALEALPRAYVQCLHESLPMFHLAHQVGLTYEPTLFVAEVQTNRCLDHAMLERHCTRTLPMATTVRQWIPSTDGRYGDDFYPALKLTIGGHIPTLDQLALILGELHPVQCISRTKHALAVWLDPTELAG